MTWSIQSDSDPVSPPIDAALATATALQRHILECGRVLSYACDFANARWDGTITSFTDNEFPSGGPHLVNTSTALIVLGRCPRPFCQAVEAFNSLSYPDITGFYSGQYQQLRAAEWDGYWPSKGTTQWSPYVTALALGAIAYSAHGRDTEVVRGALSVERMQAILSFQIHALLNWLESWAVNDQGDYDHVFFAFTAFDSLATFMDLSVVAALFPDQSARFQAIRQPVLFRFSNELHSHLSYHLGGMYQHLDAASLVLSTSVLSKYGADLTELPDDVLEVALDAIFSLQHPTTGQWDTSTPLLGMATGRVGCSSVELAIHLLRIRRAAMQFDKYYNHFDRLFRALQRGFDAANPERGWPVDIRRTGSARQTWYGFFVFEYVALLAARIREYAADLVLSGFRYTPDPPRVRWPDIADYRGFKERVGEAVINPRSGHETGLGKSALILFGPPGTGKTTIAHALAGELGWGMVELGPGNFLTHGLEGVFAQGDLIFQRLMLLEEVLVLFDEIDELVSVREADSDKMSRFLTTYMLPWIQRLRDRGRIVFIFATNHIEFFDPAVRRIGRIDLVLPVGPPVGGERVRVLRSVLDGSGVPCSTGVLENVSAQAEEWRTIGEIAAAIEEEGRRAAAAPTSEGILSRLQNGRPAISSEEWETFRRQTDEFAPTAHQSSP